MSFTTNELRESFLSFFEKKGHFRECSSPLIPQNDPTLLFTNAGMVQFKDCFTGKETRSYKKATTCQKCVRAGGKHNDLESVGFTKRHHTFFEMLGNFSFGDYFKAEAIEFAWEYLTKIIGFPKEKLWISIYEKDEEALKLWKKIAFLPTERIVKMDDNNNFWAMGDTGPCGPCSEIYYDRGETFGKNETILNGGDRFLEIWNLVFMQFERKEDGKLIPLPRPSVDTGMGLERLASVVQNVESNYLIDSMQNILGGFSKNLNQKYGQNETIDQALQVLTDHIRAISFLMADHVQPSNEGRGYVLRRILRRAIRYGKKIGCNRPFFHRGVEFVTKEMGHAYPEIIQNKEAIEKMIYHEEEKFFETLETGLKLLESKTKNLSSEGTLSGEIAFQLYDTYGFPLDLTEIILKEKNFRLDHAGFERELEAQKKRSRTHWKGSGSQAVNEIYKQLAQEKIQSTFTGYETLHEETKIVAILVNGQRVSEIKEKELGEIIIEKCPFYAESGGQVGDTGIIQTKNAAFIVQDTQKPAGSFFVLKGEFRKGLLKEGEKVNASVDQERRLKIRINHTITHVLHATLKDVLGKHIKQAGSYVHPDYLRFDFSHFKALTNDEIETIEKMINERIQKNYPVQTTLETLEHAIQKGAVAFFDEKYGETVRVLSVGGFSKELCGGTHAERLGEAGIFKITSESSVASGVRRIVALTGQKAYDFVKEKEKKLETLCTLLRSSEEDVVSRAEKLITENKELQKKISQRKKTDEEIVVKEIGGIKTVIKIIPSENPKELRSLADHYKQKIKSGVVLLGTPYEGKATVLMAVTEDLAPKFLMNHLIEIIAKRVEGKGGGKPTLAQVGGTNLQMLTEENLFLDLEAHIRSVVTNPLP